METLAKKWMAANQPRRDERRRRSEPPPPPPSPSGGMLASTPAQAQARSVQAARLARTSLPPRSSLPRYSRDVDNNDYNNYTTRRQRRQAAKDDDDYEYFDNDSGSERSHPDMSFSKVLANIFSSPSSSNSARNRRRNRDRDRPVSTPAGRPPPPSAIQSVAARRRALQQPGAAAPTLTANAAAAALRAPPPSVIRAQATAQAASPPGATATTATTPAVGNLHRPPPSVRALQAQLPTAMAGVPPKVAVPQPQPAPVVTPQPVTVPVSLPTTNTTTTTPHPADGLPPLTPHQQNEVDIVIHNLHMDARGTCRAVRTQPMAVLLAHMMGLIAREQLLLHSVAATVHSITIVLEDGTLNKKRKKGFRDFTAELVNLPGIVDGGVIEHNEHIMPS